MEAAVFARFDAETKILKLLGAHSIDTVLRDLTSSAY